MAMFPKLPPVIPSSGLDVIDALPLKESVKEAVRESERVPTLNVVDVPADGKGVETSPDPLGKRFVIVCSRDLSSEDEAIFKQHGKTLRWKKESFLNLPFEQLDFDFLFIDVRSKEARLTLGRQDLSLYHKVAYVYAIQKGVDDFLAEIDTVDISSIPQHAINGKDFRHQLLNQKMTAPSLVKSVFRFFVGCFTR
jgi:hypothetical protein